MGNRLQLVQMIIKPGIEAENRRGGTIIASRLIEQIIGLHQMAPNHLAVLANLLLAVVKLHQRIPPQPAPAGRLERQIASLARRKGTWRGSEPLTALLELLG